VPLTLKTPLNKLSATRKRQEFALKKLNLKTIEDLIFYLPSRYEDLSQITKIQDLEPEEKQVIQGEIASIEGRRTFKKKMFITEAQVRDETGSVRVIWFNQPYLLNNLKKGHVVNLAGKVNIDSRGPFLSSPACEILRGSEDFAPRHTARIVPVYPESAGLTSRWIRFQLSRALPLIENINEFLPEEIISRHDLILFSEALKNIHFPQDFETMNKARQRLAFNEIFLTQLWLLKQRLNFKAQKAFSILFDQNLVQRFLAKLSFELTPDQKKSAWEIFQDIEKPKPMNRLLNGDVGSGKTVVAALAALTTAKAGYQTVFMVPTEILALQHFNNLTELFKNQEVNIALSTSKTNKYFDKELDEVIETKKPKLIEKIKQGEFKIIIGTHALISKDSEFKNLALAIIDEQHRFGVLQRAKLIATKSKHIEVPHLLSMSATPIPRTLTLALYGDLDISLIEELPRGRKKIITKLITEDEKRDAYQLIRDQIKRGQQAFVVCPRIDPQTNSEQKPYTLTKTSPQQKMWLQAEVKAVDEEFEKLKEEIFPEFNIAKLHGKIKTRERAEILSKLQKGEINILVATSMIEVGMDLPQATVMMIESAERFGLAQLHQLRGRIGRSHHQSYCLLFTNKKYSERLKALVESENGFDLAQKDLEIRGPGDIYGVDQWGYPDLALASLLDARLLKKARTEVVELLKKDALLKAWPLLYQTLNTFRHRLHLE
jgi:ATP-dependent DNA helicase RecG